MLQAVRYHDFSYGHRVVGHEGACKNLHGHNGRITFYCEGLVDSLGRVIDFSVIKHTLCAWVEAHWDHRFLVWEKDPMATALRLVDPTIVLVKFNPTAENLAQHLLHVVGPHLLKETGVTLVKVQFEETRKCSAIAAI